MMSRRNYYLLIVISLVSIPLLSGVLFGQRVIDLEKVWGDMRVLGGTHLRWCGHSVAYGDINGDGYMDIIIGTPGASPDERSGAGGTYVIFGSTNPPSTIELVSQSPDITIYGVDLCDQSGWAVASGDINGDDYDDIIIGTPWADPHGSENAGETYVIFGSSSPPATIDLSTQPADITVYGEDYYYYFGWVVASGDVNGDGYEDIIIGAIGASPVGRTFAGETYVIFGANFSSPPYLIDLSTQPAEIAIYGDDDYDRLGVAVASGDINGDGYDDIIIGADAADPGGRGSAGETYVIFGYLFSSPPYTIDLNTQSTDITIYGKDEQEYSGAAVASGDVNGDGYHDIIIGAPEADTPAGRCNAGRTYVILGSGFPLPPYIIDLHSQPADITIYGNNVLDFSGYVLASGDVNGDGYNDIIIGSPGPPAMTTAWPGKTYVIFGSSSPPLTIYLESQQADITLYGEREDYSGSALASGDVNGDGYDDLIIGAYFAYVFPESQAGKTYLVLGGGAYVTSHGLGGKSWIKSFSLLGRDWGSFKAFGTENTQGEVHIAVGDIDGDGHDEIAAGHGEGGTSCVKLFEVDSSIIGSFKAFGAQNSGGEVHLAIGNFDTDLSDTEIAAAQGEGGQSWVKLLNVDGTFIRSFKAFGKANTQGEVHLASGDLNMDGIDEIIAGMGEGGSSLVKVFNLWGDFIRSFQAFDSTENPGGEVHLALGNFDADPAVEIAVATGYNGGNKVRLFDKDGTLINEFTAFEFGDNINGDVEIAAADIDNDGVCEIICGHGEGGSSMVKLFKANGTLIRSFKAFGAVNVQGEVHLGKSNY